MLKLKHMCREGIEMKFGGTELCDIFACGNCEVVHRRIWIHNVAYVHIILTQMV